MNPVKWLLRILLVFLLSHYSFSVDTITQHHFIKDNNDEVIVSGGKIFALGFFSPGSSRNRYVGIWYHQIPGKTVVWVANRDNPINDTSGILRIDGRGNLVLFQGNQTVPVWSTNISIAGTRNIIAQILDSGNLVLIRNDSRKTVLWQCFGYPTDTWLSFMKIGFNLRTGLNQSYTSWKSPDDPGVGNYSFRMNPGVSPQMVFYKGSVPLWRSGTWTGQRWSGIPQMTNNFIFNDSFVNTDDEVSFSSDAKNASIITRWVANETGVTQRVIWNNNAQHWIYLTIPKEQCDFYGHCGPNGYCNPYVGDFECTCFPGFEPKSKEAWIVRDRTGGCVRKRGVSMCGNGEGFVRFPHAKVPDTAADALVDMSIGLKQCEEKCPRNFSCIAYASANSETNGGVGCLTWQGDLMDARAYTETGQDLYIRVDKNDLERSNPKEESACGYCSFFCYSVSRSCCLHVLLGTKAKKRFDIEKFDGRINFGLWQVQVKDILIQSGLYKALKGKPASLFEGKEPDKPSDSSGDKGKSKMSEEEWEELDMRAASQIRLCLAKNVLANVARWSSTKELWENLEEMYKAKSLSNRLYLKEKFHKLQMEEGTKISDHLSALNGIVSEMESIGVEIDDEDKALRLIWSLPSSYEHMQTVLMYGKENVNFSEVTSKLISEERRLKNGENKSSESEALSVCGNRKKYKGSKKKIICWGCGQPGHLKKDCKNGGANSANGSKSDATNVVVFENEDDEFAF
ncbi:G-type lectin S-receptor-like serine/threonine-protein kinase RKS1 [Hibiscus syriacus]|uniref:G-type lectin S-receptor-like serine/threonine-protein kinase RKS1 n=1 Tax=Hibiscus syriacus TaxID=106335 RepID=UPI001923D11C|nr:G-type lectin S-receptor-like serine/threonine-protein kinase RKS1 [Hibiscus syriacus]